MTPEQPTPKVSLHLLAEDRLARLNSARTSDLETAATETREYIKQFVNRDPSARERGVLPCYEVINLIQSRFELSTSGKDFRFVVQTLASIGAGALIYLYDGEGKALEVPSDTASFVRAIAAKVSISLQSIWRKGAFNKDADKLDAHAVAHGLVMSGYFDQAVGGSLSDYFGFASDAMVEALSDGQQDKYVRNDDNCRLSIRYLARLHDYSGEVAQLLCRNMGCFGATSKEVASRVVGMLGRPFFEQEITLLANKDLSIERAAAAVRLVAHVARFDNTYVDDALKAILVTSTNKKHLIPAMIGAAILAPHSIKIVDDLCSRIKASNPGDGARVDFIDLLVLVVGTQDKRLHEILNGIRSTQLKMQKSMDLSRPALVFFA